MGTLVCALVQAITSTVADSAFPATGTKQTSYVVTLSGVNRLSKSANSLAGMDSDLRSQLLENLLSYYGSYRYLKSLTVQIYQGSSEAIQLAKPATTNDSPVGVPAASGSNFDPDFLWQSPAAGKKYQKIGTFKIKWQQTTQRKKFTWGRGG